MALPLPGLADAPLAIALVGAVLAGVVGSPDRDLVARAAVATLGSGFVAYGLRQFLRAFGGGYYCCHHAYYAAVGLLVAGVGWLCLLVALRGPLLVAE